MGIAYRILGRVEESASLFQCALVVAREIGDRRNEAFWLDCLGFHFYKLKQFEQATELYKEAIGRLLRPYKQKIVDKSMLQGQKPQIG